MFESTFHGKCLKSERNVSKFDRKSVSMKDLSRISDQRYDDGMNEATLEASR